MSKTCTKCGGSKQLSEFFKLSAAPDGLGYQCKSCARAQNKAGYEKNKDKQIAQVAQWQKANPERVKEIRLKASERWRKANPERVNEWNRQWRERNPAAVRTIGARKRAYRHTAKTSWDEEFDILVEKEAHDLCLRRAETFGFPWHVDHIVPLKAKLASGLHNTYNLAVIPAVLNMRKKNRHWPDMPC